MATETIWKFQLDATNRQQVFAPHGAQFLSVGVQGGIVCLWAKVDPTAVTSPRTIRIFGTGHDVDASASLKFIGTALLHGGSLVLHVFEEATA